MRLTGEQIRGYQRGTKMSEFLVKMDTHNRCCDCPMCYDYMLCRLTGKTFGEIDCVELIADWCPLIKLPSHGRLIDADALIAAHKEVCSRSMKFNLDLAPTIIEADKADMDSFIRIFEEDDEEDGMDSFIRILKD